MGLMKKTLGVATLGTSVAAEKAVKAGAGMMSTKGLDVSEEEGAAGALFAGMSHEGGRNAHVTLYDDRIERVKERSRLSMSSAKQDTEVTAIKSVSSVQAKKDGMLFTKVTAYASGNNIDFKFRHDEAQKFKDAIMSLILDKGAAGSPVPTQAAPDIADQIKKLAELCDVGVLTSEEFDAKKTELLAKM